MKKVITMIITLSLLFSVSFAEVDLKSYSFDELRDLYHKVMREMVIRPEWKDAEVHPGVYVVGEDIPAGSYTIALKNPDATANIFLWGAEQNDYETNGGLLVNELLYGDQKVMGKIILKEGNILHITADVYIGPFRGIWF